MANGKVTRRGVLTVDLDCERCDGTGTVYKRSIVGWGPGSNSVIAAAPCKCVETVALPDGALKEG
jgi:RecJ-like exonuclease